MVQRGQLERVGTAAMLLAADPYAVASNYVPEDPENILGMSRVLNPGDDYTVYFDTPEQTGAYPFVCTFPGHWQVMRGILYVLEEETDVPTGSVFHDSKPRAFVKMWKTEDLAEQMTSLDSGSWDRGREVFCEAGCIKCHVIAGEGAKLGPH